MTGTWTRSEGSSQPLRIALGSVGTTARREQLPGAAIAASRPALLHLRRGPGEDSAHKVAFGVEWK